MRGEADRSISIAPRATAQARAALFGGALVLVAASALAGTGDPYSVTLLGKPLGAGDVQGVRMNVHGEVAGWSHYFGQGEPALRGWVWAPGFGFSVLPSPPGMPLGRFRAMDISDSRIIAGDGGGITGIAWRFEHGRYETFGAVGGLHIAYLGGVNDSGDVAGTATDAHLATADEAFLEGNGMGTTLLTPIGGGRATDVNDSRQVCGYTQGPGTWSQAYRWDELTGQKSLGLVGLGQSFARAINADGDVVGSAVSSLGDTSVAWIYTDATGMRSIPAPATAATEAVGINAAGTVVGNDEALGPRAWLWTGGLAIVPLDSLIDPVAAGFSPRYALDINDAGQILTLGYDVYSGQLRAAILTPPEKLLLAEAESLSVAVGGTIELSLWAGSLHAGELYIVLGSHSGTKPGIPVDGLVLPLNFDPYFLLTFFGDGLVEGGVGTLDASGSAVAAIVAEPGLIPAGLAGTTLHHAFAAVELSTLQVALVSAPVVTTLTP